MNLKEQLRYDALIKFKQRSELRRLVAAEKRKRELEAAVQARNCSAGLYPSQGSLQSFNGGRQ